MGRVVLEDLLNLLSAPDIVRVQMKDDSEVLFSGFWGILRDYEKWRIAAFTQRTVKEYRTVCEIRSKDWKEKGLIPPMLPDETPQYSFKDMQVNVIHEIWI